MYKIIIAIFLLCQLCLTGDIRAQHITEKRVKEITENLKKVPLLKEDADFASVPTTHQWPNESAVLLSHKTTFDFDKKSASVGSRVLRNIVGLLFAVTSMGSSIVSANSNLPNTLLVEERERRQILLQDKYAVDKYSVIYFRNNDEDLFAARVVKKNGSVVPVLLDNAVASASFAEVPVDFTGYTDLKPGVKYKPLFYKIAIPDLEPGDMIDYEFLHANNRKYIGDINYKEFDPVYYRCEWKMPVVQQVIEVSTSNKNFLGYRALRGAGKFEERIQDDKRIYRWVDKNRARASDLAFMNPLRETAILKFQIIYASNRMKDFIWFNDLDGSSQVLSPDEFKKKAIHFWDGINQLHNVSFYSQEVTKSTDGIVNAVYKRMKKNGIESLNDDDYARQAYYFLRSFTLRNEWYDFAFAKIFSGLLRKRSIPHDIIVSFSNDVTDMEELAFNQEVIWGIRLKGKYYFNPADHLNPGEIPSFLAGNECITFSGGEDKARVSGTVTLPNSDTVTSTVTVVLNVSIDTLKASLKIQKETEANGTCKEAIINDILEQTPYAETDLKNYGGFSLWEYEPQSVQDKMQEDWDFQKKQWKEEKPKTMKAHAEMDYARPVTQYNQFRIIQDGRNFKKTALRYAETFVLAETISKVGQDLIIDLPLLITQQGKAKKEERVRDVKIDIGFARTERWKISLTIPEGYQVGETDNLRLEEKNSTGLFVCKYTTAGNQLQMDIVRQFYKRYFPPQQWTEILSLLNTAYGFGESKIVLKKIQALPARQ